MKEFKECRECGREIPINTYIYYDGKCEYCWFSEKNCEDCGAEISEGKILCCRCQ